jgi:predicted nuclease with TOPRIM domain
MDKLNELKEYIKFLENEKRQLRFELIKMNREQQQLLEDIEQLKKKVEILEETSSNNFSIENVYDNARI